MPLNDDAAHPTSTSNHEFSSYVLSMIQLLAIRATAGASKRLYRELHIGSTDFRVMSVLAAEPGSSGARIAQVIGRDEAAVSRSVVGLIGKKLIEDVPTPGRARRMVLTDEGRAVQGRAWQAARERERRLLSVLEPVEREQLRAMLQQLLARMDQLEASL